MIADTAASISASFDALNADGNLRSIALTDGGTLELTAAQARAGGLGSAAAATRIAGLDAGTLDAARRRGLNSGRLP